MSRLIDADYFKEQIVAVTLKNNLDTDKAMPLLELIDALPTAFDTEKLISGLEEEKDISYADFDKYVNDYELDLDSDYDDLFHKGIERAIDVIRKGGVKYE